MSVNTSLWAHVFMTAYLLFVTECVAQKVYFDCGAKVDVVDVQGLVLSPGFPLNYSSGTHCVWQFFVPVGYQLFLEIFDFDVFESHDASAQYAAFSDFEDDEADREGTAAPASLNENRSFAKGFVPQSDGILKVPQSSLKDEVKRVVVQEGSAKMETARVSNSAKRSASAFTAPAPPRLPPHPLVLEAQPSGDKAENSVSSPLLRGDPSLGPKPGLATEESTAAPVAPTLTFPADTETLSPETQQSILDACPHDVLYISDLIAFSSRFCGSNRPSNSQLVFGSSQEMVEVIMELITTTHWGRGFALLFHYHNHTAQSGGGDRHAYVPAAGKVDAMLAAISGAAFCATVLTSALCVIFRPKLCPKRASSCSSNQSEVQEGVQNRGADGSELQLVTPNQPGLEVLEENDNNNLSLSLSPPHTGSSVGAGGDTSHNAELELSSNGLTELDLGTDEVFIISSAPSPSRLTLSTHTDRFLRHSDTGPMRDWPSPDPAAPPAGARVAQDGSASCARPRAWSVRTFQDFLPPLPQLHKKWCSWNSTSPFTKLVDSAPSSLMSDGRVEDNRKVFSDAHLEAKLDSNASDSSISTASYPLTHSAQRQRRLNSASNLRRSRFTGPCFGLLSGPPDPAKTPGGPHLQASSSEPPGGSAGQPQAEADHISVPVFVISEEEDRQPLVLTEHLAPPPPFSSVATRNGPSRGGTEEKASDTGSPNADPLSLAHSPLLLPRGRSEWRPWGSQASGGGGASPLPSDSLTATAEAKSAFVHSSASQTPLPSLSQSTMPCSVMGKEM